MNDAKSVFRKYFFFCIFLNVFFSCLTWNVDVFLLRCDFFFCQFFFCGFVDWFWVTIRVYDRDRFDLHVGLLMAVQIQIETFNYEKLLLMTDGLVVGG